MSRASATASRIIKFDGDFDDDKSLVLAETDYFDRLAFDSALDVKFRADALGKTVLFVGYSLSDMNVRLLLYRFGRHGATPATSRTAPPYVFMMRPNPIEEAVLKQWGISMVTEDTDRPEDALEVF